MEDMTLERKVLSTNEWGLVALLHEGLIDRCKMSTEAIKEENHNKLNELTNKSREILTELIVIFSNADELSTNLRNLYMFVNKLVTEGQLKKDENFYLQSIEVINPIFEGFRELENKEDTNIVSGLTYGKGNLDDYITRNSRTFEG